MTGTPRILLTNDDGVDAPGLAALAAAAAALGDVTVVAPASDQSGASHALTIRRPVHLTALRPGWFAADGTPTDCVNLAFFHVLDRAPDLVLSGVNAGFNMGEDVTYSGTVAGALEGRLLGAPSLAVSTAHDAGPGEFAAAAAVAVRLAREVLARGLPLDAFLNVNVPRGATGFRVTRQGRRLTKDGLRAERDGGSTRYWVGLAPSDWHDDPGSDAAAVRDGVISVTPLHADLTFFRALPILEGWKLPGGGPGGDRA